jgi:hypothetical protein
MMTRQNHKKENSNCNSQECNLKRHFLETKSLLKGVTSTEVAHWFLNEGYFPERYVLPPSFKVSKFKLQEKPYNRDCSDLTRRNLEKISYPKTLLTSREFGIIHPWNYHDIVYTKILGFLY